MDFRTTETCRRDVSNYRRPDKSAQTWTPDCSRSLLSYQENTCSRRSNLLVQIGHSSSPRYPSDLFTSAEPISCVLHTVVDYSGLSGLYHVSSKINGGCCWKACHIFPAGFVLLLLSSPSRSVPHINSTRWTFTSTSAAMNV